MDSTQFMGMLIAAIVVLLSIATGIAALIINPIIKLNKSITKLNDSIDKLNGDNERLEQRVTKHGREIDEHTKRLIIHDKEIEHMKEKLG